MITPMQLAPGMAERLRPDKIEKLKEIDDEIGRLQAKRRRITLIQIIGIAVIFALQSTQILFLPTITGNEDVDFAIKWSWPFIMLAWSLFFIIPWGAYISRQISRKTDEFFEELRS